VEPRRKFREAQPEERAERLAMIFVISPLLGWTWPSLVPVALAVASAIGYKKLTDTGQNAWLRGELTAQLETTATGLGSH
jgi:hypothetical protein